MSPMPPMLWRRKEAMRLCPGLPPADPPAATALAAVLPKSAVGVFIPPVLLRLSRPPPAEGDSPCVCVCPRLGVPIGLPGGSWRGDPSLKLISCSTASATGPAGCSRLSKGNGPGVGDAVGLAVADLAPKTRLYQAGPGGGEGWVPTGALPPGGCKGLLRGLGAADATARAGVDDAGAAGAWGELLVVGGGGAGGRRAAGRRSGSSSGCRVMARALMTPRSAVGRRFSSLSRSSKSCKGESAQGGTAARGGKHSGRHNRGPQRAGSSHRCLARQRAAQGGQHRVGQRREGSCTAAGTTEGHRGQEVLTAVASVKGLQRDSVGNGVGQRGAGVSTAGRSVAQQDQEQSATVGERSHS